MKFEMSAGRAHRSVDVKDHCERFVIKAENRDEARELALFAQAVVSGRQASFQYCGCRDCFYDVVGRDLCAYCEEAGCSIDGDDDCHCVPGDDHD